VGALDSEKLVADRCYKCNAALEGAEVCPQCGREQYRVCYCGEKIPVAARVCPYCGADWSQSHRTRRKSRHSKLDYKKLARFAGLGALATLVAAGLTNIVIASLARRSLSSHQVMPSSFLARVELALQSLGQTTMEAMQRAIDMGASLVWVFIVILIGAGLGAVTYLARSGFVRLRSPRNTHKRRSRTE